MNKLRCITPVSLTLFLALFLALFSVAVTVQAAEPAQVNFGKPDNVLDLKPFLSSYRAPGGGTEADGSSWYIVQVSNDSVRPATRVLLASQPPRAAPHPGQRPALTGDCDHDLPSRYDLPSRSARASRRRSSKTACRAGRFS